MENTNTFVNDDLDFSIEEVEQVVAPQISDGDSFDPEASDKGVSCSRKAWCC
ncbi:MAG: hypothetical protein HY819_18440 [Acidobacteria bacterium]|nr:hypothetical protein [Acidobacteriota bacterium]